MNWHLSHKFDKRALPLADAHYNRRKIGSPQFVPPGQAIVLLTAAPDALWITSWPFAEFTKHDWPGAWICSCFRNEGPLLSSDLIRQAIAVTRDTWPLVPDLGMVTFVNPKKVRRKRDPGRCFLKAGFKLVGLTKGGLLAFQMIEPDMPPPMPPHWPGDTLFKSLAMSGSALANHRNSRQNKRGA